MCADLQELIHLMQDNPAGGMVRCSKARSMFAMRACRKSVMIGRALSRAQMQQVGRSMVPSSHLFTSKLTASLLFSIVRSLLT